MGKYDNNMKQKTFEDYMGDIHMELFPSLLDDDISDHFDNWLGELDGEDYMRFGEIVVLRERIEGIKEARQNLKDLHA